VGRPRVLITGASGLLGAHLMVALSRRYEVMGVDRHSWWGDEAVKVLVGDLESSEFLQQAMRAAAPDILLHCAAMTNVDACERDPARAYAANAALTRELVRALPARCLAVYISTDSVFSGDVPFATEDDAPGPRTIYGRSKLEGEQGVVQATDHHLIVRTNFYGWSSGRKTTSGEWLYRALAEQQPVTLFTDVFFTPIYVVDLAQRLVRLLAADAQGIVHIGGRERLSKHEFGRLMAELGGFGMDRVRTGSVKDAPLPAPRPRDVSLNSQRCARLTGLEVPEVRAGLQRFLADRGRPLTARVTVDAAGSDTPVVRRHA